MRTAIPLRDVKSVAEALATLGVLTRNPSSNDMAGSINLVKEKLILRIECVGKATLYDPAKGSINLRIPIVTWDVPFGRKWTHTLATHVHAFLKADATPVVAPTKGSASEPPPAKGTPTLNKWGVDKTLPALAREPLEILERCAQGQSQSTIKREMGCAHSTVRRVVEGQQFRGKGADRTTDPYMPELDPTRRALLQRRDPSADDEMVASLRARLTTTTPSADPPPTPTKGKKAPTLDLEHVSLILARWGNGDSISSIADDLPIKRHNATIRVHRIIVGEHHVRSLYEPLYRSVKGTPIDPLRLNALAQRKAAGTPPDDAEHALRRRLNAGR